MRAALLLVWVSVAHADPDLRARADVDEDPPLTLDPSLRFDTLGESVADETKSLFRISPHSVLATDVRSFTTPLSAGISGDPAAGGQPGWTAGAHYDVELRWGIHLEVDAAVTQLAAQMNGMFDRGRTVKTGVALTRYFHWGEKNIAWISLGVEHEDYYGDDKPITVPQRGTTVGLRVGTTF
ncbi:MAG: hypothetical protein QM831_43045 [Kofleriaceae bacterium]